jgi:hypothetical protein
MGQRAGLSAAALVAWGLVLLVEFAGLGAVADSGGWPGWLAPLELSTVDTQLWLWLLPILAMAVWFGPQPARKGWVDRNQYRSLTAGILVVAGLSGVVHWGLLAWLSAAMGGPVPAYHDEFSYTLQADMLRQGVWALPAPERPELFDQMHVLNRGVRSSRYFPGTGIWIAGWSLVTGQPGSSLGQTTTDTLGFEVASSAVAVAGSLAVVVWTLLAGRLGGLLAAALAGCGLALAPGLLLFHSLILAHAPTELGLGVLFLAWTYQPDDSERTVSVVRGLGWALIGGAGLALAMLCRPLTAAGVALPLGLVWLAGLFHARCPINGCEAARRAAYLGATGLALPLLAGFGCLASQNHAVTGSVWVTPYSLYTERYTPRHVYGFNNGVRGNRQAGPDVLTHYDEWAENLTLPTACGNLGRRLVSSWRYTLGLVPMVLWAGLLASVWSRVSTVGRALLGGVLTLHAVYFPYWYDGIMHWHYVYESAVLWIVLAAIAVSIVITEAWTARARLFPALLLLLWGMSVAGQVTPLGSTEPGLLARNVAELRFAKRKQAGFRALVATEVRVRPAVVVVQADPSDRHLDYVANPARLDGEVLIVRALPPDETSPDAPSASLTRYREWFPGRAVYLFDAQTGALTGGELP